MATGSSRDGKPEKPASDGWITGPARGMKYSSLSKMKITPFWPLAFAAAGYAPPVFEQVQGIYALYVNFTCMVLRLHLGEKDDVSPQHKGLGKTLLAEAERIAAVEFGAREMFIMSGVGARPYYRALGYSQKNNYMYRLLSGD
jgi:hypothetical protein